MLEYDVTTSRIELEEEALAIINAIDEPIAVIAVGKDEERVLGRNDFI